VSSPDGWINTSVEETFEIVGGGTPSTRVPDYWSGDIPWISSADIDQQHNIDVRRFITKSAVHDSATNLVPAGSVIVVTRVGLGKVAIAPTSMCFSQDSQALIQSGDHLNSKYVLLYMSTAVSVFKHISRGTTISGVTTKQLRELPFNLPPRPEQDRIVAEIEALFSDLDAAVSALKRVQANLKRYRASVLKAACEGRLVPTEAELAHKEGRTYETGEQLLVRILKERRAKWEAEQLAKRLAAGKTPKDDSWKKKYNEPEPPDTSNMPNSPDGWTWARVEQLSSIASGQTPKGVEEAAGPTGDIPWLKVGDMNRDGNELTITNVASWLNTEDAWRLGMHVQPAGTIIFPKRGGAIATNKKRRLAIQSCYDLNTMGLVPITEDAGHWIWTWFLTVDLGTLGDGSNVPQINHGDIAPLAVPLPPASEQERIVAEVENRLSVVQANETTIGRALALADRLRHAILKRAFEGKLVPQDPNDEPASALLERIRAERAPPERRR